MMDNRTGLLETADTLEELERRIPAQHRGPIFIEGELVPLRGGMWRVAIGEDRRTLTLTYAGPDKLGATRNDRRRHRARGKRPQ